MTKTREETLRDDINSLQTLVNDRERELQLLTAVDAFAGWPQEDGYYISADGHPCFRSTCEDGTVSWEDGWGNDLVEPGVGYPNIPGGPLTKLEKVEK